MPSSACKTCADRKSTRLNSSHLVISYAVFCLKKKVQRFGCTTVCAVHLERESSGPLRSSTVCSRLRGKDSAFRTFVGAALSLRSYFFLNEGGTPESTPFPFGDALHT